MARPPVAVLAATESRRFDELVQAARPHFLRVARKSLGRTLQGRVSEDDVVQDTAAKVLTAIAGNHRQLLDDAQQFERFFVIALQNCIKERHSEHRRQCRDQDRERPLGDVSSSALEPSTPSTRSPSRTLGRREIAERLRRVVDGLGPVDRRIVLGRVVDEKSYPELSGEVGLSIDATRKRFTRLWAEIAPRVSKWLGIARGGGDPS